VSELNLLYHVKESLGGRDAGLSYEAKDPVIVLQISGDSRRAALPVYRCLVARGRTIYFDPARDSLLSAGLETFYQMNGA
jgi:hypothetical protein